MQLTQEDINEFKEIYRKEYGTDISDDQAREMGTRLLRFSKVMLEIVAQTNVPAQQSESSQSHSSES